MPIEPLELHLGGMRVLARQRGSLEPQPDIHQLERLEQLLGAGGQRVYRSDLIT